MEIYQLSQSKVFSEAYNASPLASSVNMRSGGVDISKPLAKISSGLAYPATFTLCLVSKAGDHGLDIHGVGSNWKLNVPGIDALAEIIYLSDGSAEKYDPLTLKFIYRKLDDCRMERLTGGGYVVKHKNGTLEYMGANGQIAKLVSPSGHCLDFVYEENGSELRTLKEIKNGAGDKISISYPASSLRGGSHTVTVTQMTGTMINVVKLNLTRINQDFYRLDSVSQPNDTARTTRFEYKLQDGLVWVSKITTPNGQVQKFTYSSIKCSDTDTTPVVSKLEIMGEHQEDSSDKQTIIYEYSERNFTGYTPGVVMLAGQDNCILRTDDYKYTVTEIHNDVQYARTFNRFHLLVTEKCRKVIDDGVSITTQFEYPIVKNKDISQQPANYSLWKKSSTTYREGTAARVINESREYDSHGNLLMSKDVSGVVMNYAYYPQTGEVDRCPADPNGFANYLKEKRTTPNDAPANIQVKSLQLRYSSVAGLRYTLPSGENKNATMVLVKEEKENGIHVRTYDYLNASASASASASRTVVPPHPMFVGLPKTESIGSSYVKNHVYTLARSRATIRTEHVSSALKKTTTKLVDVYTGLTLQDIDFSGAVTNYLYDELGRIVSKAEFIGTAWERSETYAYEAYQYINNTYGYKNTVTITASSGLKHINYLDFNGRHCYTLEALNDDAPPYCVRRIQYNAAGLIECDTEYDKVESPSIPARHCENNTTYAYSLRKVSSISFANGTTQKLTKSLVLNAESAQFQEGAIHTTTFNDSGLPIEIKIETVNASTILESYEYDGFGRKTKETLASGGRHVYAYDLFDRVITKTVKSVDDAQEEDVTSYTYSSNVKNMYLPTVLHYKTRINNAESTVLYSTREYDGFGRLIQQDSQKFEYDMAFDDIPSKNYYEGTSFTSYISQYLEPTTSLVNSVLLVGVGADRVGHTYSKSTGWPSNTTTGKCDFSYTYNERGQPTTIFGRHTHGETQILTRLAKHYSANGKRLMSATNHLGVNERYTYSATGDLVSKVYEGIATTAIEYNADGNISHIHVLSSQFANGGPGAEHPLATITLSYNDLGLESGRKFEMATATAGAKVTMLDISNTYDAYSRLSSRTIRKGASRAGLGQAYTYLPLYGQLERSTLKRGNVTEAVVDYQYAGGQKLASIEETGKPRIDYTYQHDRVSRIQEGNQSKVLTVDFMGNITRVDNRTLHYNAANQIAHVTHGGVTYNYFYEPSGRLSQIANGNDIVSYLYDGDELASEISGSMKTLYLRVGGVTLGRYISDGADKKLELYGTDSSGTVRCVKTFTPGSVGRNEVSTVYYDYSDYGVRTSDTVEDTAGYRNIIKRNTLGFNGCLFDDVSATYILGHGYRPYSPTTRTFLCKDSFSPYGVAGVNRYQYCNLDPVNNIDPSGHLSYSAQWGLGLGILGLFLSVIPIVGAIAGGTLLTVAGGLAVAGGVLGATSSALGIASALTEENEALSANLGYASLAFGVASLSASVARSAVNFHLRALRGVANAQHSARTLGGTAHGPIEYYQRTNRIVAEGAPFVTQGFSGTLDSGGQLATRLRPILQGNGPVTLASCFSSVGGQYGSQAQRLANALGRSVTGFSGYTHPGTSLKGATVFHPQSGAAAAATYTLNNAGAFFIKAFLYGVR